MTRHPLYLLVVVLLACGLWPRMSLADCSWVSGSTETVTMTISPSTMTLNPNLAVGSVLATSAPATPNPSTSQVNCSSWSGSTPIGVINLVGGQPSGSSSIFPTNVPGVGYQILHPDSSYILPAYGNDSISGGFFGTPYTLSVGSAIQLVKTGPIASGATLNAGTLGYWQFSSGLQVENFVLANPVTFVSPSCTVNTNSQNMIVTLPTISTSALGSVGATAGRTPFNIGLTCAINGTPVYVTMATNNTQPNVNGVIAPTSGSGYAANVGVQILNGQSTPVSFGTAQSVGNSTSTMTIPYYAQYYETAAPVSSGKVSATATFTLSYQ